MIRDKDLEILYEGKPVEENTNDSDDRSDFIRANY